MVLFGGEAAGRLEPERLIGVIARHGASPRPTVRQTARAVFVQTGGPPVSRANTLAAAAAHLDNRAEIAAALSAAPNADDADIAVGAFERDGDAGLARLLGTFALAHWDETAGELTLARDYMGYSPLFYHVGDHFAVFASLLADLLALPQAPRELDERMLANFLALNHRETESTFYRGIVRVPSRSVVRITAAGIERRHYWSPRLDAPAPYSRDADYIDRARELFDRAVTRSLRDAPRVAVHLSGGLDSSAVAATAARLGTAEIACYTGVPPADLDRPPRKGWYLDERPKVEALASMHPSLRVNFITPRGAHVRQSDPARFFPDLPVALRNVCNLGWFAQIDDAIAADGQRLVLTGTMGNMTLSWTGGFLLSSLLAGGRVVEMLRQARAIARSQGRNLARVIAAEAVMPLLPPAPHDALQRLRGVTPEDVDAFSLLRPQAVEALELRRQWRADGFDPTYALRGTSARLRAHQIFDQLQLARDIYSMRQALGEFEVRDPFCDRDLVEFSLAVPETLFRRDGIERWFARQVFADRLPPEIINETRSGEQAPNWFELLNARKAVIEGEVERIEASALASRLIDTERLKRLIAEWPADARAAQARMIEYRYGLDRAVHVGQFIRWVEGGNA